MGDPTCEQLRERFDRLREYIDDMPRRHRQEWATASGGTYGEARRHGESDALWRVSKILDGKEP
jgi:hypothetical protein